MAEVASAFVSLVPSAKGFGSKLNSQVGGEVQSSGKGLGSKFGTVFKVGALAALGGAAVLGGFLKGSLDEAREAQKVGAQTNAVIKSTGGVANVTAAGVAKLAGAISAKAGIDDEAIATGANLLLTFTNVRNEAGKGNKVFDQTVRAATDMSVALGTDTKSAAMQLGKALNDPIKGVTKLQRSGVTFTDQQKKQITTLVNSGKTLKAQKIILAEVNKEFGGSAAASATAGDKFKVAFGNLQESVGTALLPLIDKVLGGLTNLAVFLTNNVGPGIAALNGYLAPAIAVAGQFFSALGGGGAASGFLATIKGIGATIASNFLPVLRTAATTFQTVVLPAILSVGSYLASNLLPIFRQVASIIGTQVVPIIARLAQFFYGTLVPAVYAIATAVAARLKPVFDQLFKTIQTSVLPTIQRLLAKFREWQPTIEKVVMVVLKIIGFLLKLAATILAKVLPPLIRFNAFLIGRLVSAVIATITVLAKIIGVIIKVGAAFVAGVKSVARWVSGVKTNVAAGIAVVRSIPDKAKAALGSVATKLFSAGMDLIRGLINGIKAMAGQVAKAASDVVGNAISAAKRRLGIHSPSKVFHKIGEQTGQGLHDGLKKSLAKAAKHLQASIDGLVNRMSNLTSASSDMATQIADTFKGDAFTGGLTEFKSKLTLDIGNARAFTASLSAAAAKGLSGPLYRELASKGAAGMKVAQELSLASPDAIRQYEELFNTRNAVANRAGQVPADRLYAADIHTTAVEIQGLRKDLARILARERKIEVHDKSGSPKKTAKEVARRQAFAGGH